MKSYTEHIISLRYKMRMFGIPIDGAAKVLCDNQSCVDNSSKIDSTLNMKYSSLAYHFTRHSVVAGIINGGKIE